MSSPNMLRNVALFVGLAAAVWSCSDSGAPFTPAFTPPPPTSSMISVTPGTAFASSPDITVSITGSGFDGSVHGHSEAVWSVNGTNTLLATTFVSGTLLTAVVPGALLRDPVVASLFVQTGDPMGDIPLRKSAPFSFVILASTLPFSVAPASAAAGSPDVTITVQGSDFHHNGRHDVSEVVLSVNGTDMWLATTFVDGSELTAVIPAALLTKPVVAVVSVWTGDPMAAAGEAPESRSGAATFTVTP
jgi:hypothetical protein